MKHLLRIAATAAALAVVRPSSADDKPPPAPAPTPSPEPTPALLPGVHVEPFAEIVGGLKLDTIIQGNDEHREGRVSAIMLSDFGLRGTVGDVVSFESELMANGGTGLHGSSAWEGQAQLQVRKQLVRVASGPWMGEVGRVIDEGSVDFFSAHVADTMLQDTATRDPLLYSGFNLGDGVRGTFEALPGLRVGLAFTAGNPVSNTASLQVGGSFPPFDRFYIQPYQAVNQSPNRAPDDTFHMMLFAPSVLYTSPIVEARAEFQSYIVDTNTNSTDDQNIHGYNARVTAKLKLFDDLLSPFANFAFDRNDTVDPNDVSKLVSAKYTSITAGGGLDFNYAHAAPDRPDGVGLQYERVQYQVGSGDITNLHYVNVGTTYWLNRWAAVGARFALWVVNAVNVHDEGERSGLLTLRVVL
ncbi:MAG TPA: hypothetical protein VIF15_08560 [Polyangiaceae bacterium]|jgi:hypothetical protein